MEKPRTPIVALVAILAFFSLACLLVYVATAPLSAAPPAAYRIEDEQAPPDAAEAARTPAVQTPAEQALAEQTSRGPAAPSHDTRDPADERSMSEQRTYKARTALETVDPRELLRRSAVPPAHIRR